MFFMLSAGLVVAIVAAVPVFTDYLHVVEELANPSLWDFELNPPPVAVRR